MNPCTGGEGHGEKKDKGLSGKQFFKQMETDAAAKVRFECAEFSVQTCSPEMHM